MFCSKLIKELPALSYSQSFFKSSSFNRLISTLKIDDKYLVVGEDKGNALKYPTVWLRDNCRCSECFHTPTNSRILKWSGNQDAFIVSKAITSDDNSIHIQWKDKHLSVFDLTWLKERRFTTENRKRFLKEFYKPDPLLWGKKDFPKTIKKFEFKAVKDNDTDLLDWLLALAVEGFAIIENVPNDKSVVKQLADRIGFIKRTTYGETFEVQSKEGAQNYSYLMTPLPLHTDMPFYEYKPGINILHFLVQSKSKGGSNLMTDGFYVAAKMRKEYPKHFEVLRSTPVDWLDVGNDSGIRFHSLWRQPIICLDYDGRYQRINQNVNKRDSHFNVSLEEAESWYEAYTLFLELINEEAVQFKMQAGQIFTFNNLRMVHGRTAYIDSLENKRHLIGAYVDWDLIYSKIRILKGNAK